MYLAMDEIGDENCARIPALSSLDARWEALYDLARGFGFRGIQMTPAYDRLGLPPATAPEYIRREFRLTYHLGGKYLLNSTEDANRFDRQLADSLILADKLQMEDVSVHPPRTGNTDSATREAQERLAVALSQWLPRYSDRGITLSLETHITLQVFAIQGPEEYRKFVSDLPGLGVLVDVSHNHNNEFDPPRLLEYLRPLRITGLHLSDAVAGVDFTVGTHLPVGRGEIDFRAIMRPFIADDGVYGALEVRGQAAGVAESARSLHSMLDEMVGRDEHARSAD